MNHEEGCFCELAPLYSLDLLTPPERQWVGQQAAASPELAAELAELQATVGALSYSAPAVPVATDLKDRLFQRLSQESAPLEPIAPAPLPRPLPRAVERSESPAAPPSNAPRARNRAIRWLVGGAIAALALVALRTDYYRLLQSTQDSRALIEALQQPDAVVYTLRGTDKAAQASGRIVVSPSQKAIAILTQNLPPLQSGQAYRLWALPIGATKPTYCGQFDHADGQPAHWFVPEAVCSSSAQLLITTDLATAPPVPTDTLVLKSVI